MDTITGDDGCRLHVTAAAEGDRLGITYRFANGSGLPAFLFNRVFMEMDEGRGLVVTGPNLVYVNVGREAVVAKKIPEVPEGLLVEARAVPCLSRVGAGSQLEETIELVMPLLPQPAYAPAGVRPGPVQDRPLVFELGYFLAPPAGEKLIRTVKTTEGEALRVYPFQEKSQRLLRAAPGLTVPARPALP